MTYEKKSVIELREIAKERKIKGISTLKKKELIETLEKYDQENYKEVLFVYFIQFSLLIQDDFLSILFI